MRELPGGGSVAWEFFWRFAEEEESVPSGLHFGIVMPDGREAWLT